MRNNIQHGYALYKYIFHICFTLNASEHIIIIISKNIRLYLFLEKRKIKKPSSNNVSLIFSNFPSKFFAIMSIYIFSKKKKIIIHKHQ